MQTLQQIRQLLDERDFSPRKQFGQCFLIDHNLMGKLLNLADLRGGETVLEVGPGTGSLTEELLSRAGRVVAVEIDRGLCQLLTERLGDRPNFTLIGGDALAGKHALSEAVLEAIGPVPARLVANLPYNIATPLIAECLISSWRTMAGKAGRHVRFESLTFTVQREMADRLAAGVGGADYGPVSVLVALLGRFQAGPVLPPSCFWPSPKVSSRMARIDFDADRAAEVTDIDTLTGVLAVTFGQRRKQLGAIARRRDAESPSHGLSAAFAASGIDPTLRAEAVAPEQLRLLANAMRPNPKYEIRNSKQ
jgi:16S rRNA (adenine1518-N6/adenine1519-N6)-dimethyltransferase